VLGCNYRFWLFLVSLFVVPSGRVDGRTGVDLIGVVLIVIVIGFELNELGSTEAGQIGVERACHDLSCPDQPYLGCAYPSRRDRSLDRCPNRPQKLCHHGMT